MRKAVSSSIRPTDVGIGRLARLHKASQPTEVVGTLREAGSDGGRLAEGGIGPGPVVPGEVDGEEAPAPFQRSGKGVGSRGEGSGELADDEALTVRERGRKEGAVRSPAEDPVHRADELRVAGASREGATDLQIVGRASAVRELHGSHDTGGEVLHELQSGPGRTRSHEPRSDKTGVGIRRGASRNVARSGSRRRVACGQRTLLRDPDGRGVDAPHESVVETLAHGSALQEEPGDGDPGDAGSPRRRPEGGPLQKQAEDLLTGQVWEPVHTCYPSTSLV